MIAAIVIAIAAVIGASLMLWRRRRPICVRDRWGQGRCTYPCDDANIPPDLSSTVRGASWFFCGLHRSLSEPGGVQFCDCRSPFDRAVGWDSSPPSGSCDAPDRGHGRGMRLTSDTTFHLGYSDTSSDLAVDCPPSPSMMHRWILYPDRGFENSRVLQPKFYLMGACGRRIQLPKASSAYST